MNKKIKKFIVIVICVLLVNLVWYYTPMYFTSNVNFLKVAWMVLCDIRTWITVCLFITLSILF